VSSSELRAVAGEAARPRQADTPYLDALTAYAEREAARYHVPGHKGGLAAAPGLVERIGPALELDIPACTRGIDTGLDPSPFEEAQARAAEAWRARRTWFLVNGASEGSHAVCLALAHAGNRVVVQRNAHSSTIHGLVMAGLRPAFVAPEVDPELRVAHCITPDALDRTLTETPDAVGVIVVSPTYFGAVADVRGLAEVSHARGIALVVDEAWGAHFAFHEALPEDALSAGADLVISGTHKLLGSLTQSAMLHLGHGAHEVVDEDAVVRALGLVRSTSPSSLLFGSLDAARSHAAVDGPKLLEEALPAMGLVREAIRELPGLEVLDEGMVGRPGVYRFDPFRLVIDIRRTGVDGYTLSSILHRMADINLELVTKTVVVAQFGLGESVHAGGLRLVECLAEALGEVSGSQPTPPADPHPPWGPLALSPREAFFAPHDVMPLELAEGRISADSLAVYPPGIPNVLPGERLTAANIGHIRRMVGHGCMLRGTADGSLAAVRVVREAR
jgi:arginine decarboxylase